LQFQVIWEGERLEVSKSSTMQKDRKKVIQALKDRKTEVTAADVSSETGLPLAVVSDDLTEITKQDGSIDVKETGELSFKINDSQSINFPMRIKDRVAALSTISVQVIKTWLSLLFITTCLVVFDMVLVICLAVSFAFAPFLTYKSNHGEGHWLERLVELPCSKHQPEATVKQIDVPVPLAADQGELLKVKNNTKIPTGKQRSFISECNSYLFGHSNPNEDMQEVQMRLIGRLLASKQGIVIAEELAPYMLEDTDDQSLLPILAAFDGHPEVSDTGTIIYVFPSFANVSPLYKDPDSMPGSIEEHPWNGVPSEPDASAAIALAATLNFFGSCWLRAFFIVFYPIAELIVATNFLLLTSFLFLSLPLIRMSINVVRNKKIANRNAKRKGDSEALREPSKALRLRLGEAVELRNGLAPQAPARIVYTTSKDLLEQQF